MKRRNFIKNVSAASAGTFALNNIPIRAVSQNTPLFKSALASNNDNVLIFVQLHGGNDALNTLVPIKQYTDYITLRANISLPDQGPRAIINVDDTIAEDDQIGLHPDMEAFKNLYDQGKAVIIQNVGYPDMNMSHFRGRDLVFMGLDGGDDALNNSSGWMGRYLNDEFPGYPEAFPNQEMEDPIALELGSAMSLAFHREEGIPIGLNIPNPAGFFDLVQEAGIYSDEFYPVPGHAGVELEYLWQFKEVTNQYAERLKSVYDAGSNSSVEYPTEYPGIAPGGFQKNGLSNQLRIIARLLKGGSKTKIFLCRLGGFDTHGGQVDKNDHTLGAHAALLYHLSSAIKAFQDDLEALDIEDKVLTMTFTEFGRRVHSNDSYGTDHGTSTPVFVFGKAVDGKVVGTNPDLNDLERGNMKYDIDYRNIYTSVVQDWFGADDKAMQDVGFSEWVDSKIDLFGVVSVEDKLVKSPGKFHLYPNPASDKVQIKFFVQRQSDTILEVFDVYGRRMIEHRLGTLRYGHQNISVDLSEFNAGQYICRVRSQNFDSSETLIVQ